MGTEQAVDKCLKKLPPAGTLFVLAQDYLYIQFSFNYRRISIVMLNPTCKESDLNNSIFLIIFISNKYEYAL